MNKNQPIFQVSGQKVTNDREHLVKELKLKFTSSFETRLRQFRLHRRRIYGQKRIVLPFDSGSIVNIVVFGLCVRLCWQCEANRVNKF